MNHDKQSEVPVDDANPRRDMVRLRDVQASPDVLYETTDEGFVREGNTGRLQECTSKWVLMIVSARF